jgi:hypothetical protein
MVKKMYWQYSMPRLFLLILVCSPLFSQTIIDSEYENYGDQLLSELKFVQQQTKWLIELYNYKKFNPDIFIRTLGAEKRNLKTQVEFNIFNFINRCLNEMDAATSRDSQGKYFTDCDDYANIYIKIARFTNKERLTNIKNLFFAFSKKWDMLFV